MKFSIICPVYNSEKYLDDCIQSVINQTYRDWELILIDDGSSDKSNFICGNFSKIDKRISLLKQNNKGPFLARQNGMKISSGTYIMFLDSDDVLVPNALEILYSKITRYPDIDIIVFKYERFPRRDVNSFDDNIVYNNKIIKGKTCIIDELFFRVRNAELSRKAIRSDIVRKSLNCDIYTNSVFAEDLLQSVLFFIFSESVLMIDDVLYKYRNNLNSTTNNIDIKKAYGKYKVYCQIYDVLTNSMNLNCSQYEILNANVKSALLQYLYRVCKNLSYKETINVIREIRHNSKILNINDFGANKKLTFKSKVMFALLKARFYSLFYFLAKRKRKL